MPHQITVPRLGWTMEEGTFVEWLKRDGDTIVPGDKLFVLEGEKATEEIESLDGGVLHILPTAPIPGSIVAVGALLGYLLAPGEALPDVGSTIQLSQNSAPPLQERGRVEGTDGTNGTDRTDGTRLREAAPASATAISPRARRTAKELGVDWTQLQGSGRTGRIRERDIRTAATANAPSTGPVAGKIISFSPLRKLVAERMSYSARNTAPVTLVTKADATNLVSLRKQFQATASNGEPALTYTDLIVKLAALALEKHPQVNACWQGEQLIASDHIHIGIAVDTDAGLLVPVVRDVPSLPLRELAAQTRSLIERARARRLATEQQQGGTFTVTNLGMYGIDAFTPIVNWPQIAILGLGRIVREPAVHENQIIPRDQITLSLTFDHRALDGAPAARFFDTLRRTIENPQSCLTAEE